RPHAPSAVPCVRPSVQGRSGVHPRRLRALQRAAAIAQRGAAPRCASAKVVLLGGVPGRRLGAGAAAGTGPAAGGRLLLLALPRRLARPDLRVLPAERAPGRGAIAAGRGLVLRPAGLPLRPAAAVAGAGLRLPGADPERGCLRDPVPAGRPAGGHLLARLATPGQAGPPDRAPRRLLAARAPAARPARPPPRR